MDYEEFVEKHEEVIKNPITITMTISSIAERLGVSKKEATDHMYEMHQRGEAIFLCCTDMGMDGKKHLLSKTTFKRIARHFNLEVIDKKEREDHDSEKEEGNTEGKDL